MHILCLYIFVVDPSLPFFFFNDPPTTEIYTLSLHDALPISSIGCTPPSGTSRAGPCSLETGEPLWFGPERRSRDRKSTRLNSSHTVISYAVFCLKKKKKGSSDRRNTLRIYTEYGYSAARTGV